MVILLTLLTVTGLNTVVSEEIMWDSFWMKDSIRESLSVELNESEDFTNMEPAVSMCDKEKQQFWEAVTRQCLVLTETNYTNIYW